MAYSAVESRGFDQYGYSHDQLEEISQQYYSSKGLRVRAALFPETVEEGTEIPATQLAGHPSAVDRLAEPSQMLKQAVQNIVNYNDDAETTIRAIPELVKLFQSDDRESVKKATDIVHKLSTKDASRTVLMRDSHLVPAMLRGVDGDKRQPWTMADEETLHAAAGAMFNLSRDHEGLKTIFQSLGIPFLIKLLSFPNSQVRNYAISTLHNLMDRQPGAKEEIFRHGGIQAMVSVLKERDPRFLSITCDSLKLLTIGNQEAKVIMSAVDGSRELLQILIRQQYEKQPYEKLLQAATSVLKALSVEPDNKKAILNNDGLEIMIHWLQYPHFTTTRVQSNIMFTIRNLSDMIVSDPAFKDKNLDRFIEIVVDCLKRDSENGKIHPLLLCATGILSNLTCNNQRYKQKVFQLNGIHLLLQVCQRYPQNEEVTEPSMCTLRHITNRQPDQDQAKLMVKQVGGLQIVANMLNQRAHWTLIKAIVGFIQNIGSMQQNRAVLRDMGVVDKLLALLRDTHRIMRDAAGGGSGFAAECIVDNVRVADILESLLGAVYVLSKDPASRVIVRNANVAYIVCQLLQHPAENVQRFAAALTCELADEPEGVELLERSGALVNLSALLRQLKTMGGGYETTLSYVCNALYKMSEGRPDLRSEIRQVLAEPGIPWGQMVEAAAEYDYMLAAGDGFQHYQTSAPPSVHGSVHGSILGASISVYEPDLVSGDLGHYNAGSQVWEHYATPTINPYDVPGGHGQYQQAGSIPDSLSWKDSDV